MDWIFKGVCAHVIQDAYQNGDGYDAFVKREYEENGYQPGSVERWKEYIKDSYGRNVVNMSATDEDIDVNLCRSCLLEMVRELELYESK